MIGALVSLLSLDMTRKLVESGRIAKTLVIIGATNATPVVVETSVPHGIPYGSPVHAVVSDVNGNEGANGLWVMTTVDTTHLVLTTFSSMGVKLNSIGTGDYVDGGMAQIGFPAGRILLGARTIAMQTAVATPRIVFIPLGSPEWVINPAGGVIPTPMSPGRLANLTDEQKFMLLNNQINTEASTFEVHVSGCATPPDPVAGDFDETQAIYQSLYGSMYDMVGPSRAKVLSAHWESQDANVGKLDIRGQRWVGIVQIYQYVTDNPLSFVPADTDGTLDVNFINGASTDSTIIIVPQ